MDNLDLRRIEIATEDQAARYYGGPLRFTADDAARYTAEGRRLDELCRTHGLPVIWRAVAAVLRERPELLTDTEQAVELRKEQRRQQCYEATHAAAQAVLAGRFDEAQRHIDRGELIDPDYLSDGWRSWESLRNAVAAKAAA